MRLTFWGAARQVTGSMFMLEMNDGYTVLVDCGWDMDRNEENKPAPLYAGACFPFDASMVNAVLLTHAHLDHSGRIPNLYKDGFEGQVLCTTPTMELTEIILADSARINQEKLRKYHRKRSKNPGYEAEFSPGELYNEHDVKETMREFLPVAFNKPFSLTDNLRVTFLPAGHLLGAANILIEAEEDGEVKRILFSGDIGRHNYPLLVDPAPMPEADYVVCETTYGNRRHKADSEGMMEEIERIIKETCIDIPGRLIIPAFSIGRTQAILYTMNRISKQRGFPPIKVFSDSPMAAASNRVYQRNVARLNRDAKLFSEEYHGLFDFSNLVYVEDTEASKALSNHSEPCVIVSSSGMMEGGRIQHHVQHNLSNPYCTILMVGFSADGTLGRKLLDGLKRVTVGKQDIPVNAKILHTDAFSGHGDLDDLLLFMGYQDPQKLKGTFLVHGELTAMEDFADTLDEKGYKNVRIPKLGESVAL